VTTNLCVTKCLRFGCSFLFKSGAYWLLNIQSVCATFICISKRILSSFPYIMLYFQMNAGAMSNWKAAVSDIHLFIIVGTASLSYS